MLYSIKHTNGKYAIVKDNYFYVYSLICPIDKIVKYVGKSNDPLCRLNGHLSGRDNPRIIKWIRFLKKNNLSPIIKIHSRHLSDNTAKVKEKLMIKRINKSGVPLFNQYTI